MLLTKVLVNIVSSKLQTGYTHGYLSKVADLYWSVSKVHCSKHIVLKRIHIYKTIVLIAGANKAGRLGYRSAASIFTVATNRTNINNKTGGVCH
jgi:hypothetical protein